MWKTPAALFVALFALLPGVLAISAPDITFIPENISRSSDFVLQVDPHASAGESIRATWVVGGVENGFGLFPRVGDKWFCHFSDDDPESSCGPVPFEYSGAETVLINVTNSIGENYGRSVEVVVGGIELRKDVNVQGDNVVMHAWPYSATVNSVSYQVYSASTLEEISGKGGTLDPDPDLGKYTGSVTLSDGEYFISFEASATGDYGGTVARVVVGEGSSGSAYDVIVEYGPWRPVINIGQSKEFTAYSITNNEARNFTEIRSDVPDNLEAYLSVDVPESLERDATEYYTLRIHGITSPMSINSVVDVYFNDSGTEKKLAGIPVDISVSVINATGGGDDFCASAPSGTFCNGGVCCSHECLIGGECCSDSDCDSGETCNTDNLCVASSSDTCSEGTCRQSCRAGEASTGEECTKGDITGVCCAEVNECEGKDNGDLCSEGVCCYEECVECCTDSDCPSGQECSLSNSCVYKSKECTTGTCRSTCRAGEASTGEDCDYYSAGARDGVCCVEAVGIDPTLIIVVVAVVAGLVVVYFLLKSGKLKALRRGGKKEEEEELGEEDFF
jgi:hypothetical protein